MLHKISSLPFWLSRYLECLSNMLAGWQLESQSTCVPEQAGTNSRAHQTHYLPIDKAAESQRFLLGPWHTMQNQPKGHMKGNHVPCLVGLWATLKIRTSKILSPLFPCGQSFASNSPLSDSPNAHSRTIWENCLGNICFTAPTFSCSEFSACRVPLHPTPLDFPTMLPHLGDSVTRKDRCFIFSSKQHCRSHPSWPGN